AGGPCFRLVADESARREPPGGVRERRREATGGIEATRSIKISNSCRTASMQPARSVVERFYGPSVRARQPGTHARPAAGGEPGESATAHWCRSPVPAVAGHPAL